MSTGLTAGSLVSTNAGLRSISTNLKGYATHCGTVLSKVQQDSVVEQTNLTKICLKDGTILEGATEQQVLAKQDEPNWYPLNKLKLGMFVGLSLGAPKCETMIPMRAELITLLALMLEHTTEFYTTDPKRFNLFSKCYSAVFKRPLPCGVNTVKSRSTFYGKLGPNALDYLTDLGLGTVGLPWSILNGDPITVKLYLTQINPCVSNFVAQQVKMLWQRLGHRCEIVSEESGFKVVVKDIPTKTLIWSEVTSIKTNGVGVAYALQVGDEHTFTANGIAHLAN